MDGSSSSGSAQEPVLPAVARQEIDEAAEDYWHQRYLQEKAEAERLRAIQAETGRQIYIRGPEFAEVMAITNAKHLEARRQREEEQRLLQQPPSTSGNEQGPAPPSPFIDRQTVAAGQIGRAAAQDYGRQTETIARKRNVTDSDPPKRPKKQIQEKHKTDPLACIGAMEQLRQLKPKPSQDDKADRVASSSKKAIERKKSNAPKPEAHHPQEYADFCKFRQREDRVMQPWVKEWQQEAEAKIYDERPFPWTCDGFFCKICERVMSEKSRIEHMRWHRKTLVSFNFKCKHCDHWYKTEETLRQHQQKVREKRQERQRKKEERAKRQEEKKNKNKEREKRQQEEKNKNDQT